MNGFLPGDITENRRRIRLLNILPALLKLKKKKKILNLLIYH